MDAVRPSGTIGGVSTLDLVGAVLGVACAGWLVLAPTGDPAAAGGTALAAGGAFVAARAIRRSSPVAVQGLVAILVVATVLADPLGTVSRAPTDGPLGYANARASLLVIGSAAAAMVAGASSGALRVCGLVASVGLAVSLPVIGSAAGTAVVVAGVALVALAAAGRPAMAVAIAGAVVAAVVAGTVVVGVSRSAGGGADEVAERAVGARRVQLWGEAVAMVRERPLTGWGYGAFAAVSPTARADADGRWAHHDFLQLGAEAGAPAAVSLLAAFGWILTRLARRADVIAVLAAIAVAGLAVHACVDHLLGFPVLPIAAAALAGAGIRPAEGERWSAS